MLIVRFYMAMDSLVTEGTFVPDFTPEFEGLRAGIFVGRYYTQTDRAVGCDDLTNSLHRLIKMAENGDAHDQICDWFYA